MTLTGVVKKLLGTNNYICALIKKDGKGLVLCISNCNTISITVVAAGSSSDLLHNTEFESF